MKFSVEVLTVAVMLLLVIGFSSCSNCQKFVPYSPSDVLHTKFTKEGFSGIPYSSYPENTSVDEAIAASNSFTSNSLNASSSLSPVRLWGFSGLYSSPDNDKPIDMFGPTPGSLQCFNRSFGLAKSTGPLCVNQEQYALLTTRGGNQSGIPAQVGGH